MDTHRQAGLRLARRALPEVQQEKEEEASLTPVRRRRNPLRIGVGGSIFLDTKLLTMGGIVKDVRTEVMRDTGVWVPELTI